MWFVEKWKRSVNFSRQGWLHKRYGLPISSKREGKMYGDTGIFTDLPSDLERVSSETGKSITLAFLHETGNVTLAIFNPAGVTYGEAEKWASVDEPDLDSVLPKF